MSDVFRLPVRERWAAREAIVERWRIQPGEIFEHGQVLADVRIDGVSRALPYNGSETSGGVYRHLVAEGQEIGPWGYLLEYSDMYRPGGRGPTPRPGRRPPVYRRRSSYPRIFLNYRRDDADAYAGRLHEALSVVFGADEVFMAEFSLRGSEPFAWTIQQAVTHADIVVSLIGPRWATLTDDSGKPRLANERDYVRRELAAAMDRGIPVVPVTLPNTAIPRVPYDDDLYEILDLQMIGMSAAHWKADVAKLVDDIQEVLRGQRP
jgi:TIR domain-containing protein